MDEITLKAFKEKLKQYYLKENGEKSADDVIENFSKFAISQNKENNAFFYSILLSTIKQSNIPLIELNDTNNSIIKQVIVVAKERAIEYQEKVSKTSDNKTLNEVDQIVVEKSAEEILIKKEKVAEYIEKYGGFEGFLYKATKEELDTYIEVRKSEKILSDADAILIKLINSPEIVLTEEEKNIIKNSKVGQKFEYDEEKGIILKSEAEKYVVQAEKFRNLIERRLEDGKGKISKEQLEEIKKGGKYNFLFDIKSNKEITQFIEKIVEDYKKLKEINSQKSDSQDKEVTEPTVEKNIKLFQQSKEKNRKIEVKNPETNLGQEQEDRENIEELLGDVLAIQEGFEEFFNMRFENMIDPALDNTKRESVESIQEINTQYIEPEDAIKEVLAKSEEVIQAKTEEPEYKTPTIEVEKKGLAKWFDKLKQSRNPFARLITGQIGKKKENLLLNESNDKIYEDKPSKGRFDATDSVLMPAGKGIRNSIIRMGEGIMSIFKLNKEYEEPKNLLVPVKVSDFEKSIEVGDDVKANTTAVGVAAATKENMSKENKNSKEINLKKNSEGR